MATAVRQSRKSPARKSNSANGGCSLLELSYGHGKVDAVAGVIHDAKIVGLESRNVGRTIGLDPEKFRGALDKTYGYGRAALESAIPKYEGAVVRLNHPPTSIDGSGARVVNDAGRGVMENVGVLKNVRFQTDGLYGDIHLLKTHPSAPLILEMAEKMPNRVALSHNAYGLPVMEGGRAVINQIIEVYSVDIVGDKPGTTNGLFESYQGDTTVKRTFKQIVESLAKDQPGKTALEDMASDAAMGPLDVESTTDASPDELIGDALKAAAVAIISNDSIDSAAKLAKLKQLFKIQDQVAGATDAGAATQETVVPAAKDPAVKQLLEDVAALKGERDELKAEKHARQLLEDAKREATPVRINAVKALSDDAGRKALIETWPKQEQVIIQRPRTSAPLLETDTGSYTPTDGKSLAAACR